MLTLDQYKDVFNRIKEYALVVSLYNHAEPLLNPDVFRSLNIPTVVGLGRTSVPT